MTTINLGKIEQVTNLREIWPNEAQHFTPWLAKNLDQLSEALGMDLELQQIEAAVGGYSLDILSTDQNENRPVIIENQLESTDHTHLGQLLTYAAGHDANIVVWLTKEFRDEHRAALDWLNQRTGDDTQFFGVAVELWKIGDSLPAPHFRVVASPNEWSKSRIRPNPLSSHQQPSRDFRHALAERMRENDISVRPYRSQSAARYLIIEYVIQRAWYAAIWHDGRPGFELFIDKRGDEGPRRNQEIFEALEQSRESLEAAIADSVFAEKFSWERTTGNRRHTRVAIYREGDVFQDTESWVEFQDWMIRKLYKFREVITPRLEEFAT